MYEDFLYYIWYNYVFVFLLYLGAVLLLLLSRIISCAVLLFEILLFQPQSYVDCL